ncbi:MAG: hypothetical protein IPG04_32730 [Polyangiaceae bacterium]|nr:hypothetical protein [Polyangiaceae bacterium]
MADPDGRVVQLVSISGSLADLDITGDGVVDSASAIRSDQDPGGRAGVASLRATRRGRRLWHTRIAHFSVVDLNNMKRLPCLRGAAGFPHHDRRHVLRGRSRR